MARPAMPGPQAEADADPAAKRQRHDSPAAAPSATAATEAGGAALSRPTLMRAGGSLQGAEPSVEDRYELQQQLGSGTGGVVFKAVQKDTNLVVAIKRPHIAKKEQGIDVPSLREIKFMRELSHKNLVQLVDVFMGKDGSTINLVLELMDCELKEVIANHAVPPAAHHHHPHHSHTPHTPSTHTTRTYNPSLLPPPPPDLTCSPSPERGRI